MATPDLGGMTAEQRKVFDNTVKRLENGSPTQAYVLKECELKGRTDYRQLAAELPRQRPARHGEPAGPTTSKNIINARRRVRQTLERELPWLYGQPPNEMEY